MPVYKSKSTHSNTKCFVNLFKDPQAPGEYVRAAGNRVSVIEQDGHLIEEFTSNSKVLPVNLSNDQICERTLVHGIEDLSQGINMSVLYIGASSSGKEKLADGSKLQMPLAECMFEQIFNAFSRKKRDVEYRVQMIAILNEKIYDCFGEVRMATLKLRENKWEGVEPDLCKTVGVGSPKDFGSELNRAIKNKRKLVMEIKDIFATYLSLQIIQKNPGRQRENLVSKLNFFEIPGTECLSNAHSVIKIKDSPASTRSLIGFSSLVNELSKFPDSIIHYEGSQLTHLLKEIIGCNSTLYAFLNLNISDIEGSLSTLRFLRPLETIQQFPLINSSNGYGTIKKFRHWHLHSGNNHQNQDLNEQKKQLEEQIIRLQTEQDYKRLLEKYAQLKQKYGQALKAKSEAQLELIKSEEEKIEMGKSLVEVQIENTKLVQKLQNKDYEGGKKLMNAQSLLAQREMSYQECLDKINELNAGLSEALQTKRDLEVEFIALKRNFLMQQKELKELKEDNQNLGLDVINLSKENQKLKESLLSGSQAPGANTRLVKSIENEKHQQLRRANKSHQETIAYLKSEIQRYKKEMIELQMEKNGLSPGGGEQFGKDYRRIELENENMELQNRHRLNLRKIEQLEEKVAYFMQENEEFEQQLRVMKIRDVQQTQQYHQKIAGFANNTNTETTVKELKDNFSRKDHENLDKINSLKQDRYALKKQIINLKSYVRELITLLEEWGPKGIDIPSISKYANLDLTPEKSNEMIQELRIRNIRLEEQIRRMKDFTGSNFKESRVVQETNMLRGSASSASQHELAKLKKERSELAEENRRLTVLLKDGNKMDLNILRKENENLKRENDHLKGSSAVSPATNDHKLKYYEKHLKNLERERSELLSRAVIAEEQLKNVYAKLGKQPSKLAT